MSQINFVISGAEIEPTISITPYGTFHDLKQQIENHIGIEIDRQTLMFNGSKLKDSIRIDDYNFHDTETLHLTVRPTHQELDISVYGDGDEQQYEVQESESVFELKKRIATRWGFEADDLALFHLGVEMKNNYSLSKYYIHEGSQVNLNTPLFC